MSDDSDDGCPMPVTIMPESMVTIFESFMSRDDYEDAIEYLTDCCGFIPTSDVINAIIFKIMMNCKETLAYEAADYLEDVLKTISSHHDQKRNIVKALNNKSDAKPGVWAVFSHLVQSSLYDKIPEAFHNQQDYIKSPNCDILVDIYVQAFLFCSIKSDILGSRLEERFSSLLKWINLYYKHDIQKESELEHLHNLLDYIVDSEISCEQSLPPCVKIHTVNLSQYMFLILKTCKDVFATVENIQSFFNNSMSPYLITKVSQYRLHELIENEALPHQPSSIMLTLKSIVDNYFFHYVEKEAESTNQASSSSPSPRKSSRVKKLKTFSSDPIDGDTELHKYCRSGRPADVLGALYMDKSRDINSKNSAGNTPLHEACLASCYLSAKFLIEEAGDRKVDFNATENDGRTPLHCAVNVNSSEIVKLLLSRGGNNLLKSKDKWNKKPIDYSISDEMKKFLSNIESQMEEESRETSTQTKLIYLKRSEDHPLYLRTLKNLVSNYCEIYDLPKDDNDIAALSHDSKNCYHYKADGKTLCSEDSLTLNTFGKIIDKFVSSVELMTNEGSVEKELLLWKTFATAFK